MMTAAERKIRFDIALEMVQCMGKCDGKDFEVWKDCEQGGTYKVKTFDTWAEAVQWIYENEKYYPRWHLRIVEG